MISIIADITLSGILLKSDLFETKRRERERERA